MDFNETVKSKAKVVRNSNTIFLITAVFFNWNNSNAEKYHCNLRRNCVDILRLEILWAKVEALLK